ncbi:hypothetical protein [Bacillus solitudinis]|uniref:hypothetical protein n=1 Tax=Bacillus solitudinis TaxID=2014074 RepID=UPI000C235F44|nr:hypothetical protein [Bacillus solitudinis]
MKQKVVSNLYIFYTIILTLFIINTFIKNEHISYIVGVLAILMLLVSFSGADKLFKVIGTIFLVTGIFLYLYSGLPFKDLPFYMTSTLPLLAFLMVLPWMNSCVRAGRFDRQINDAMKANVSDLGKLYVRSSLTTYSLVTFINLSALTISQDILLENMKKMKKKVKDVFISKTTLRTFAVALAWSPMEILVAMTVDATGVSYLRFLPWLILCSLLVFSVDLFIGRRVFASIPYSSPLNNKREVNVRKLSWKLFQLFIVLSVFLFTVVSIGNVFHLNFILSVTLVILPFTFCWAMIMKRTRSFLAIGWRTWKLRTNNMQNFIVLFIALAFFSNSLNETPFLALIQHPFLSSESPLIILLLIQFTYLIMSLIGVHPIATIGVLIEVLTPLFDVMNPLSIGIVMITGALATLSVGAYGMMVTITVMNTKQNPYLITLRNMPFGLFYGGVGTLIAYLLL